MANWPSERGAASSQPPSFSRQRPRFPQPAAATTAGLRLRGIRARSAQPPPASRPETQPLSTTRRPATARVCLRTKNKCGLPAFSRPRTRRFDGRRCLASRSPLNGRRLRWHLEALRDRRCGCRRLALLAACLPSAVAAEFRASARLALRLEFAMASLSARCKLSSVCRGCRIPSLRTPCIAPLVCRGCRMTSLRTPCNATSLCRGCRLIHTRCIATFVCVTA